MTRPPRTVRLDVQELEGRLLLVADYSVQFVGAPTPGAASPGLPDTSQETQVVSQEAGTATLMLSRGTTIRPQRVEVQTDPSPAVGVNVGAVDQTVRFARGQDQAVVRVPILAGAANPGEVDVTLTATPINPPRVTSSGSLVLRILAPDASVPPTIMADQGTPRGIVLAFNKPMDPAAASNVHNYAVSATFEPWEENPFLTFIDTITLPLHMDSSLFPVPDVTRKVPLRAADYDPGTNSVTLVPRRRLTYQAEITVTQGSGMKGSSLPGHPSDAPLGLTDVEGSPINADSTPGGFWIQLTNQRELVVSD